MKKFWLVVVLTVLISVNCFADDGNEILTYQVINSGGVAGAAPSYSTTAVPTTSIYPNTDRILGWAIMKYDLTANAEYVVALYDQTSTVISNTSGECLGESESSDSPVDNTVWLPYPREVSSGLLVRQGPNTVVTVYFSRR